MEVDDLLVVSYYIEKLDDNRALDFQESLDNQELIFELCGYSDDGPVANAKFKPTFLREKLIETHGEFDHLLFISAKAVVRGIPKLLLHLQDADIGVYPAEHLGQYLSHVIYLCRSARTLEVLDRWIELEAKDRRKFDPHRNLTRAIQATKGLAVYELPVEYSGIPGVQGGIVELKEYEETF